MKALACSLLLVLPVFADGIPVDRETGELTAEHVMVTLDANQREEIVVLGSLTLRPEQWSRLRKQWPSVPKRVATVLPKDWNDCTCGVEGGSYAIQCSEDRVALLKFFYEDAEDDGLVDACESGESVGLTMDARGQFYFGGKLIRYPVLLAALERMKPRGEGHDASIAIDLPLGATKDTVALRGRVAAVSAKAEAAGWDLWIY